MPKKKKENRKKSFNLKGQRDEFRSELNNSPQAQAKEEKNKQKLQRDPEKC